MCSVGRRSHGSQCRATNPTGGRHPLHTSDGSPWRGRPVAESDCSYRFPRQLEPACCMVTLAAKLSLQSVDQPVRHVREIGIWVSVDFLEQVCVCCFAFINPVAMQSACAE